VTTKYRIRTYFSTLANATAANYVLKEGEFWTEKDASTGQSTGRRKVGDGTTAFTSLPFEPGGSPTATSVSFTPAGTVAATNVQTAVVEVAGDAAAALTAHEAAADPHPGYLTAAEGNAAYAASAHVGSGGTAHADAVAAGAAGFMTGADKTKLDGIATGATANSADATLLARANHTGTQAAGTITGLATVATTGAYGDLSGRPTLGTAAATASTDYAPAAQGVTNGNSHDHDGGDGAQIAYSSLSGLPTLPTGTNTGDQTIANTSDATSHTVSLSASGGTVQLVEGSNITLTTTGTSGAGVVTIASTATASPGGSTTQVQYNNAGVFAGAANVDIISDNLQLTAPGTVPGAADASSVVVYPVGLADRFMLAMRGPIGSATLLQPSIFSNNIMMHAPQSGTVGTGSSAFQTAWTSNGTVSHPSPAATSAATAGRRTSYANVATTTNQQLGPRMNTDAERCFFRGNVAGTGGFFYFSRFRLVFAAATCRLFSGLQGVSAAASICITDTPTGPYCGLQHITTDPATGSGALRFVTHDGTTRNALAINFAANLVSDVLMLDFMMYCAPNGGTIFFRLDDVVNGVTYTNSTTTNLPGATVMMSPQCQASNGTANITNSTVAMAIFKLYVESVY
jgi:hypothetical protein